jgi:D-alanyl-D-alanine carboxypeptidase/D-alanyl-D-alanine-endopeptidase (penicillin-binding protein 4)
MSEDASSAPPPRRRRRRVLGWLAVTTALVVVAATAAAYLLELGPWQEPAPDPVRDPAAVAAPPALALPTARPARPVARMLDGETPLRPAAVENAIAGLASAPRLGRRFALAVGPLRGTPVYAEGPAVVTPASTLKLLTALTALETLGPEHRFTTRVVRRGQRLTLVGGGDPLLASRPSAPGDGYPRRADVVTLARRTAAALAEAGVNRVRLGYDESLFSGPAASPDWEEDYLPDNVVSPISALWVDEGRAAPGISQRSFDPARAAAQTFARALRQRGVRVAGAPTPARAGENPVPVAAVQGSELVEVVQHVLEVSDNEGAEVLARHVALAEGRPGSFAGVSQALPEVATRLGVSMAGAEVLDGSGLSRDNRLPVDSLLQVLALGADPERPGLAGTTAGLPVAGWSGSLAYRFYLRSDAGLGWVRAKTGTLTGVHGLAGVVTTADGAVAAFVAVADRVKPANTVFVRSRLDQVASALAACRCGR